MEKRPVVDHNSDYLNLVRKYVEDIKFGTVTVIVQDGKVVQIEKNEKYRI